ncbi:hypothetical protein IFM89_017405, partial [Coptis chinensis]
RGIWSEGGGLKREREKVTTAKFEVWRVGSFVSTNWRFIPKVNCPITPLLPEGTWWLAQWPLAPTLASVIVECLGFTRMIRVEQARVMYGEMCDKDVVSWMRIISAYVKCGKHEEAIYLFGQMLVSNLVLNEFTVSSVLQSCSSLEDFVLGIYIRSQKIKLGFESNPVFESSLVKFYSKCGCFWKLLKYSRLQIAVMTIVSPISGITRDAIEIELTGADGQKFKLINTAGIRRRVVVVSFGSTAEALSMNWVLRGIRRMDVVVLALARVLLLRWGLVFRGRGEKREGGGGRPVERNLYFVLDEEEEEAVQQILKDEEFELRRILLDLLCLLLL